MNSHYIALDIGNVLCTVDVIPFIEYLSKNLGIPISEANYFLKRFQKLHDIGFTTMEEELRDRFDLKVEFDCDKKIILDIVEEWNHAVTIDLKTLDRLNSFATTHSLNIALLSNIGAEHAVLMDKNLNHNGFMETTYNEKLACKGKKTPYLQNVIKHYSCEMGVRKPHGIFYQSFLTDHPEFRGCVYVDDLQENLDVGAKYGFKPCQLDLSRLDPEQVEKKWDEILKLVQSTSRRW